MEWIKSRTLWTQAFTVIITVIYALEPFVEPELFALIVAVLQAFAGYFRINAKVT